MNKKILLTILVILVLAGLAVATKVFFLDRQVSSVSALQIDSFPKAHIFLNDKEVGETPYLNKQLTPGDYKIKLFVSDVPGTFYPLETKIKLTADGLTYVSSDIGKNEQESGYQVLWLERLPSSDSVELAVISDPDKASLSIDSQDRGATPEILRDIHAGDHDISLSQAGFSDQTIRGKLVAGFRLNIAAKLAKKPEGELTASPSAIATSSAVPATPSAGAKGHPPKPYVVILETGLGFLRVRSGPTFSSTESARVKTGEEYSLLSETSGWDQIKLATISGYVNNQFVQKVQ